MGGSDDATNIVRLTAREHFICHRLLTKMTTGKHKNKMSYAMWRLTNCKKYRITSRTYNSVREEHSRYLRSLAGPNHWACGNTVRKGSKQSESSKKKQSLAMQGRPAWNKGIPRTQAVKDAISKRTKGRTPWNKGISRRWINNGTIEKLVCPEDLQPFLNEGWVQGRYAS